MASHETSADEAVCLGNLDGQAAMSPAELLLHHDVPQEVIQSREQSRPRHQQNSPISSDEERFKGDGRDANTGGRANLTDSPLARIGGLLGFIIVASFFILLVAICFLSWLWFEDNERESWRRIMLSGRSTQAITLTGILIRLAVGSLSTISTSMIASIAVETHGVPLPAVAEVSIARFTNNGPQSLFLLVLGTAFTLSLRFWAIVLTLSAVASQFASTLLVADLQETHVISFPQMIDNRYNFANFSTDIPPQLAASFNYWINRPSSSQTFAEYSKPGKFEDGIDDTGLTIRAFLPIRTQSERENIRNFQGKARVVDTRVVCLRPELTSVNCDVDDGAYRFCGSINAEIPQPNVLNPYYVANGTMSSDFNCPVVGGGNWVLCPLPYDSRGLSTILDSTGGKVSCGRQWLVISTEKPSFAQLTTLGDSNSTTSSPWLERWVPLMDGSGDFGEMHTRMYLTWCFDALNGDIQNLNIAASSPLNVTEPVFQWDFDTKSYATGAVRRQLGATSRKEETSNSMRGVLTISQHDMMRSLEEARNSLNSMKDISAESPYQDAEYDTDNWLLGLIDPGYDALSICSGCSVNTSLFQGVDVLLGQIFSDTLQKTGSPALAFQALNTAVLRTAYYDQILAFSPSNEVAIITNFELAQTPQAVRGFIAVIAIISCNAVAFVVICSLFIRASKFSYLGNAWHTIAQVSESTNTRTLMEYAAFARDEDVEERVYGRAPPEGFVNSMREYFGRLFCRAGGKSDKPERLFVQDGVFKEVTLR